MPPPAPPDLVAKAIDYAKRLGSAEAAYARLKAEGHAVSPRGVRNWIAKAGRTSTSSGAAAPTSPPARTGAAEGPRLVKLPPRVKPPAGAAPPTVETAATSAEELPPVDLADAPRGIDVEGLGWEGLERLVPIVKRYRKQAETDAAPKIFEAMVRLEMDVHDRLERLRPAPPVDPETDPLNLAAAELLMRKIGKLVEAAEREAAAPAEASAP